MRIFELNTRAHCTSFDDLTDNVLIDLATLGFDAIWLMGVWQISEASKKVSRVFDENFEGSPYAVPVYQFSKRLGGEIAFRQFRKRANAAGLGVLVDFVSNHMAIDSPWILERPDFFVRSNPRVRAQSTADYFLHPSGEMIAFGRDPYFPPWHDTAQLDYTNAELRLRLVELLKWLTQVADGVRCDMAMLVLRDYIRMQWYPAASDDWFNAAMPTEFWDQAIREVKSARPDFTFIAEAYWDKEDELRKLGFDLAYEKRLYDGLVSGDAELVISRLMRPSTSLSKSVYFIENHDERRAAAIFSEKAHRAAAALVLSLPGSVLIHEGQMEGRRERLPVQRIRPLTEEAPDLALRRWYEGLLKLTATDVFTKGSFDLLPLGIPGVIVFIRAYEGRTVIYVGQIGREVEGLGVITLNLATVFPSLLRSVPLSFLDLISGRVIRVPETEAGFLCTLDQLGMNSETAFCLLEVHS